MGFAAWCGLFCLGNLAPILPDEMHKRQRLGKYHYVANIYLGPSSFAAIERLYVRIMGMMIGRVESWGITDRDLRGADFGRNTNTRPLFHLKDPR